MVFVIHVNDARARSLLELGEEVYGGAKGVDEGVDVGGGVVKVEAGAGGAGNAEVAVEGLRAVVTAAAGDAGLVEEGAEVVGVDAVDVEGAERGAAARGGAGRKWSPWGGRRASRGGKCQSRPRSRECGPCQCW